MKLKENKGMSLIIFTIILVVLVAIAGGVIVYLQNIPLKENVAIQNKTEIQTNTANNQNKVNTDVQNNTENTEKNDETGNALNVETYTEEEKTYIKETIEQYYKLLTAKENSPILMLTDVMGLTVQSVQDPEYAPDNYIEHSNPSKYVWTGIKYEDFRNNLWYLTDDILKEKFSEFVEYKNYLYIENNDSNVYDFKYEIISQKIDKASTKDNCICNVTVKNSKIGKTFESKIIMSRGNGDFVIGEVIYDEKEISDAELEAIVQKYLDIRHAGSELRVLEMLGFDFTIEWIMIEDNLWCKTSIKYEDYKNAMLNFISEDFFNKFALDEQKDGYLLLDENAGDVGEETEIESIEKKSNNVYNVNFKSWTRGSNKEVMFEEKLIFTIEKVNAKYVISNVE